MKIILYASLVILAIGYTVKNCIEGNWWLILWALGGGFNFYFLRQQIKQDLRGGL